MFAVVFLLAMSAAPRGKAALPPSPPTIAAPLGHFGNAIEPLPAGGMNASDKPVLPAIEGCEAQAVYLMRVLGGSARVVEQLQQWLDMMPGFETAFFNRKGVLGEVVKHLSGAAFEPKGTCAGVKNRTPDVAVLGTRWCPSTATGLGDFWWFDKGRAAAVASVEAGAAPDACKLVVTTVLYDARGLARVRVTANWGGSASLRVTGDGCQVVDFAFDSSTQTFLPALKSCKR